MHIFPSLKKFLEAASSRRILADCHVTELAAQVTDLEKDIFSHLSGSKIPPKTKIESFSPKPKLAQRTWWNQLLMCLDGDLHFQAALQSCIDQGEAAYRK